METEQYFSEIVDPTIADLKANPTSRRHAFLACVATFHSIDYLAELPGTRNKQSLREQFRRESPDFALVDRIAHAFKHVKTGHPDAPHNPPLGAGDVIPRPPAFYGTAKWGLSRWGDKVGGVTVMNERQIDILRAVEAAAWFLRNKL